MFSHTPLHHRRKPFALIGALTATLLLIGCDSGHLPNPVLLPGLAVSNAVRNAGYNARRTRVSAHVQTHHTALVADLRARTPSPLTETACDLARVPTARRPALYDQLAKDIALYSNNSDALTVAFMVHGG